MPRRTLSGLESTSLQVLLNFRHQSAEAVKSLNAKEAELMKQVDEVGERRREIEARCLAEVERHLSNVNEGAAEGEEIPISLVPVLGEALSGEPGALIVEWEDLPAVAEAEAKTVTEDTETVFVEEAVSA